MLENIIWTHAILATLSWGLFFPLGAILVRVVTKNARNVHYMVQVLGFLMFSTAFGLGAFMATYLKLWVTWNGHAILGTVIYGLLWTMPILGILHHYKYISTKNSYIYAWIHVWLGRILILAAIINGGLGLQLGYYELPNPKLAKARIAYGVLAGVMALIWIAISVLACVRSKADVNAGGESGPKVQGVEGYRSGSQDTAVGDATGLEKEKFGDEHLNASHPAREAAPVLAPAAAPVATLGAGQSQGFSTQTTTTTTITSGAARRSEDIVHGGDHYNTRLADVIDPEVQKPADTNMFGR